MHFARNKRACTLLLGRVRSGRDHGMSRGARAPLARLRRRSAPSPTSARARSVLCCVDPTSTCVPDNAVTKLDFADAGLRGSTDALASSLSAVLMGTLIVVDLSNNDITGACFANRHRDIAGARSPATQRLCAMPGPIYALRLLNVECGRALPPPGAIAALDSVWSSASKLQTVSIADNHITGDASTSTLFTLATLLDADVGNNMLTGTLPTAPASLRSFNAASNSIAGAVPPSLFW